jgi:parallel beta-helix repeat protein
MMKQGNGLQVCSSILSWSWSGIGLALLLAMTSTAQAAVWYVDLDNASGTENGTAWATAYTTIQAGIDAAFADGGGEVWVAEGSYGEARTSDPHGDGTNTGSVMMKEGVHLYGGFSGSETARAQRDWAGQVTTIDGATACADTAAIHVIVGASDATLDGFTISGGISDGWYSSSSPLCYGGGMYNNSSSPTLTNCTFSQNEAGYSADGGGMYNDSYSSPTLTNCILWDEGSEISGPATVTYSNVRGGYAGEGNIDAAPQFANPGEHDLRIALGSPCIDAGSASGAPATDTLGTARPQGAGVDMGAYEYFAGQDSDNNGISDEIEGDADTDGDGMVDGADRDNDGDGILDSTEGTGDPDGDGIPNYMDTDSDGDGIPDSEQRPVVYVDKANDSGSEDGVSWATAFSSIQAGINASAASGGGDVWVAQGVYDEARTSDPHGGGKNTGSVMMKDWVHLYGGFSGSETARAQRDWAGQVTTIDGATARDGVAASHVIVGASDATLDGFTISGGIADGGDPPSRPLRYGGGMYNFSSSPTLTNCTFSQNKASHRGGGMCNFSSSPTLTNCTFSQNTAYGGYGGGMYNFSSSPTLTNCTFSQNEASSYSGGGGMYNDSSSSPALTNCILWDQGSEIYNEESSSASITYSNVRGGYAGEGNIDAAPLFANPGEQDLRIALG